MKAWFGWRRRKVVVKRRFADLRAMDPDDRRRVLAGADATGWIEAAAKYGLVEAQLLFGQALLTDDAPRALCWFKAAAGTGYAPGINMVGRCFEKGWGVLPDPCQAAQHYRTAAGMGFDWAQYNLASVLLHGIGVSRDRVASYDWYRLAASQGHAKAMNMLGRFHEEGWDRAADPKAAFDWYRRAAQCGDYRGQFNFGTILCQQGRMAEATAWFAAALGAGDPDFVVEASVALRGSADPAHQALAEKAGQRFTGSSREHGSERRIGLPCDGKLAFGTSV